MKTNVKKIKNEVITSIKDGSRELERDAAKLRDLTIQIVGGYCLGYWRLVSKQFVLAKEYGRDCMDCMENVYLK